MVHTGTVRKAINFSKPDLRTERPKPEPIEPIEEANRTPPIEVADLANLQQVRDVIFFYFFRTSVHDSGQG